MLGAKIAPAQISWDPLGSLRVLRSLADRYCPAITALKIHFFAGSEIMIHNPPPIFGKFDFVEGTKLQPRFVPISPGVGPDYTGTIPVDIYMLRIEASVDCLGPFGSTHSAPSG